MRSRADGRSDLDSSLQSPSQVAVDESGNGRPLCVSRWQQLRKADYPVRHCLHRGGTGRAGYHGDGGPTDRVALAVPTDAAVDRSGDLFTGDTGNHRIRRVAPSGTIWTVNGGPSDGLDEGALATNPMIALVAVAVCFGKSVLLQEVRAPHSPDGPFRHPREGGRHRAARFQKRWGTGRRG